MQGIVEIIRCIICLKQGDWPSREEDVEEVDVDKLKEMVHVKDEDIEKLDALVVAQEQGQPQMRKEVWFGFSSWRWSSSRSFVLMPPPSQMTNGHLGLLMLALIVVGDHARLPDRLHADGHGRDLRLARLSQRRSGDGDAADARPVRAARLSA